MGRSAMRKLSDLVYAVLLANAGSFFGTGNNPTLVVTEDITSTRTFDMGTAVYHYQVKKSVPLGGGSLYIFKRNPQNVKDGAWDFVKFMTSKENQIAWAEATAYFTARKDSKEALDKDGLLKKDPRYNTTYLQLGYIRPENETGYPNFLQIRTIYNEAWDKIMLQGAPVKQTLEEAAKKANDVIKENS